MLSNPPFQSVLLALIQTQMAGKPQSMFSKEAEIVRQTAILTGSLILQLL